MSTTKTEITMEEAVSLLKRAVEEKGEDHIAPRVYFDWASGKPVCIVGQILHYLGVEAVPLETGSAYGAIRATFPDTSSLVKAVLYEAQVEQDSGRTWGTAVKRAFERYPECNTSQAEPVA